MFQIHTEYFFCAVCHAEVKHCHKNIMTHLLRSHELTTQQYEAKYGEMDTDLADPSAPVPDLSGSHFITITEESPTPPPPVFPTPPATARSSTGALTFPLALPFSQLPFPIALFLSPFLFL